jgi:hypothetical protein
VLVAQTSDRVGSTCAGSCPSGYGPIGEKLPQFNRLCGSGPVTSTIRTTSSVVGGGAISALRRQQLAQEASGYVQCVARLPFQAAVGWGNRSPIPEMRLPRIPGLVRDLFLRRHKLFEHGLAYEIGRQKSLCQDEVVEFRLVELRSERSLGRLSQRE